MLLAIWIVLKQTNAVLPSVLICFDNYLCSYQETAAAEHSTWNLLTCTYMKEIMHIKQSSRLCAIYAQASCFVWCIWFLLSKVNLNWKKFSYFDPHDYHVMIINKPVTSCIHISVGCLMTPSLVWLMSPWLTGILFDHRTLIMHFTCSLQNGGQKKAAAWNDRAIKGEEALWGWWL